MNYTPDPKLHLYISILKSLIRIAAGGFLIYGMPVGAGAMIVLAELLGIAEELV